MGIESDKLVFDYLSKVGDLAQITLPAASRMRLVARLRNDIDRAREKSASDSPAVVRRILGRMGSPDEVVKAAARTERRASAPAPQAPAFVPEPPVRAPQPPPAPEARHAAGAAETGAEPGPEAGAGGEAQAQPHAEPHAEVPMPALASDGERPASADRFVKRPVDDEGDERPGEREPAPEWWRSPSPGGGGTPPATATASAGGLGGLADAAEGIAGAGWTGGLIMSAFAGPPQAPPAAEPVVDAPAAPVVAVAEPVPAGRRPRLVPRLPRPWRRTPPPAPEPVPAETPAPRRRGLPVGPLEVLAAAALVAGAALTNLILLAAGWLLGYACQHGIGRRQARFAVLGLPGLVLVGSLVWLWGRTAGHWGAPLTGAHFGTALSGDLPTILRVAAVASALYLVWRGVLRRG
jgi:hypothetical protein